MNKTELIQLANKTSHDVLDRNSELIKERIAGAIERNSDDGKISMQSSIAAATAVALTLVPEICAVITAQMLVELGLIALDPEE